MRSKEIIIVIMGFEDISNHGSVCQGVEDEKEYIRDKVFYF